MSSEKCQKISLIAIKDRMDISNMRCLFYIKIGYLYFKIPNV